jgi:hypothetical protein
MQLFAARSNSSGNIAFICHVAMHGNAAGYMGDRIQSRTAQAKQNDAGAVLRKQFGRRACRGSHWARRSV